MIESLNDGVRMVMLQFSFANRNAIPASVKNWSWEVPSEEKERKNRSSGSLFIEPNERCSLARFLGELEAERYELVDALYIERINSSLTNRRESYHTVRYLFARREFAVLADNFAKVRDAIRADLQNICETTLWRVRTYLNPYYEDGEEIPGQYAVSINLEVRQPLFHPDGQPVRMWQRDKNGVRLGDAPRPITADYRLGVMDGAIKPFPA